MRLEQTHQLLAGRHRLAVKDAPLALGEDALDQRQIVAELSAPALSRDQRGRPAFRRPVAAPPGWRGWRRSAHDRAGAGCFCRGCTRSLARAAWPGAGDRAIVGPALPATPL